ncbi:phytanoyl-CoA dioxygenase domain-containing protein 1-like [Argiope bruennichi]|uniref:phytanoyl-CoA dioxygenase domain-containing protein 1-like n=1 Tax=Argiope bruennichi TaxID=94029 RepID=UPI002493EF70|nr:phytanoyl-CoA dioxygenase domain-containing protein 1-like [Argiope bruennichi]
MDYQKYYEKYLEDGCIKIENFLTPEEVDSMKRGLEDLVENMGEDVHVHSAYSDPEKKEDEEYYINSADKIAYFFESDAFDSDGNMIVEKKKALNKIAYAVHWWNPQFKQISFSQKVKNLLKTFEYKDPVICQSMLIFKHPKIGEVFRPHQDSTFLYTEPPSCIGLWMPLEDATVENGCLWFLPGSHKSGKIYQRYERNPEKNPFMVMRGDFPDFDQDKYLPIPAKKGDLVLIHGSVLHKSARNNTDKPRIVYTFHAVEKTSKWSDLNWVQATEKLPFPSIYEN